MITKEAIDAALAAHAQWKKRLQDAITTGQSEFKAENVEKDNGCQFGQWLYGLPLEDTATDDFKKIQQLHAEFHKIAGDILRLALTGKKDDALKKLETGGPYSVATGKLVLALQSWKEKIQ